MRDASPLVRLLKAHSQTIGDSKAQFDAMKVSHTVVHEQLTAHLQ